MIKAIIFDYGGVVTYGGSVEDYPPTRIAESLNINDSEAYKQTQLLWQDLLRGRLTEPSFWEKTERIYGQPIPVSKRKVWSTWGNMQPRNELTSYIKMLNDNGYIVGLMSSTVFMTMKYIRAHGGYDVFDPCLLSCELGYTKPDIEIYEELLSRLPGISPAEILFIDDQTKCLEPAKKLGINTILATKPSDIISRINSYIEINE